MQACASAGLVMVCLLWAGMILGISFLEAPVKFSAPSLTLPVGLDVGRQVFGVFNKVEVVWALAGVGLLLAHRRPRPGVWLPVVFAAVVVALQTLWLLPLLDQRVSLILAGQTPPPAPYHVVYIVLEALKLLALCAVAVSIAFLSSRSNTFDGQTSGHAPFTERCAD